MGKIILLNPPEERKKMADLYYKKSGGIMDKFRISGTDGFAAAVTSGVASYFAGQYADSKAKPKVAQYTVQSSSTMPEAVKVGGYYAGQLAAQAVGSLVTSLPLYFLSKSEMGYKMGIGSRNIQNGIVTGGAIGFAGNAIPLAISAVRSKLSIAGVGAAEASREQMKISMPGLGNYLRMGLSGCAPKAGLGCGYLRATSGLSGPGRGGYLMAPASDKQVSPSTHKSLEKALGNFLRQK